MSCSLIKEIVNDFELIYFNNDDLWQKPVITEKQIFDNFLKEKNIPYNYIAFPWASYIDNEWIKKHNELEKIINEEAVNHTVINNNKTYFTVIQHIFFKDHIELFKKLNIKYVFSSHCSVNDSKIEQIHDIHIFPLSLFPKQHNESTDFIEMQHKKYLTSFIGQSIHKNMVSDIRFKIFKFFKGKHDCFIKHNSKWHYEDIVYKNSNKDSNDNFYKQIMMESKFSLCPSGTGPNSIRLFESLSFGAIPVLLADELVLPFLPDIDYNDCFIIWKEANIDSLYDYLLSIDDEKINTMTNNCIQLYNEYFAPDKMHKTIIFTYINGKAKLDV